jgi:hypothetical protein
MATPTLQNVYDAARGYLHDTQLSGGEVWTNSALQVHFNEAYHRMYNCLMGTSKRVERTVYVNLPANTTVLIPAAYGITDFAEPELIEERPAQTSIPIFTASAATPIRLGFTNPHGLGTAGQIVECVVSGVANTSAPWGRWFGTVFDANNIDLNGSVGDVVGSGGTLTPWSQLRFFEVTPLDLDAQGLDGLPQQYLSNYVWAEERLQFRGAIGTQQLRITYQASGSPPTIPSANINIDNCLDFLACATAANAARANGWDEMADQLKTTAFGPTGGEDCSGGLRGEFIKIQVATMQRGPQRRRQAFRNKRPRCWAGVLG